MLTARDFGGLLDALLGRDKPATIAAAVSGGADSMALALLGHAWAKRKGRKFIAFTVDHGLRPESGREAQQVARWLNQRGIACRVLHWQGKKPKANIQDEARTARYRLMAEACRKAGAQHLLLAHHLDDQAETVLMRLLRGSGVDGLSAMAPVAERDGLVLLRPLLDCSKARLIATLRKAGQDWIEDPSNRNDAFTRVRVRGLLAAMATSGLNEAALNARRLAATARNMARARMALEAVTDAFIRNALTASPYGFCRIDRAKFLALPEEIALRVLSRAIITVGGNDHSPRLESLEQLLATMGKAKAATLGGCRIDATSAQIHVCRDLGREKPIPVSASEAGLWDGRFRVTVSPQRVGRLSVASLGQLPRAKLPQHLAALKAVERAGIPVLVGAGGKALFPLAQGRELRWTEFPNVFMEFDPKRKISSGL